MKQTKLPFEMVTKLDRISKRSQQDSSSKFSWLMQHFNEENLAGCFHELDGKKAVGIDKKTKAEYGKNLTNNLSLLVSKMKTMSYRPQPVKRVKIPKLDGGERSLGIATVEDKIVQSMMAKLLGSIYDPVFTESSFGFRPNRNCHQAIKAVNDFLYSTVHPVVYEIDFSNYFGGIDHDKLISLIELRVKDVRFLRYIKRMLKSGIMEGTELHTPENGTTQGNICSPILANIFAHYAIDVWFEQVSDQYIQGESEMVRYCDDAVFMFSNMPDATRFIKALDGRIERFSLVLNRAKTKLLDLDKNSLSKEKQPSFNFLGFTFYIGRNKKGTVIPKLKTDSKRMRKKLHEIKVWLKRSRHILSLGKLWNRLRVVVRGYLNYFAISHNRHMVAAFVSMCVKLFFKWINRRSQKRSVTWEKFSLYMKRVPMPIIRIKRVLF